MPKMKSILALGLIFLLVVTGCQAILPTAQILSQGGFNLPASAPAMEADASAMVAEATPTALPTEEPTVEPTATPTEVPTLAPTATPTEVPTLAPTATTVEAPTPEPTAEPTVAAETDMSDTAAMTETMAMTETASMTETMAVTETAVMTDSAAMTETAVMTESAMAAEPTATTPATEVSAVGTATVLVQSLRIRSGPGTTFEVVGGAVQGEQYPITGQAFDCQWYQVDHPQLGLVWIAGGDFAASDGACDTIPAADATTSESGAGAAAAPAEAVATPTPATLQPTPVPLPAVAPTEAAAPAETAPAEETSASDPFPTDKGCMLLQNQLGPELTFTFTGVDSGFTETVTVNSDADVPYCLDPGRYTVTVDAPPPWADINEEFTIAAGDRFFFPIRPQ